MNIRRWARAFPGADALLHIGGIEGIPSLPHEAQAIGRIANDCIDAGLFHLSHALDAVALENLDAHRPATSRNPSSSCCAFGLSFSSSRVMASVACFEEKTRGISTPALRHSR